jgi:hypothetical protein
MKKLKLVIPAIAALLFPLYMKMIWENTAWMSEIFYRGPLTFICSVAAIFLTALLL